MGLMETLGKVGDFVVNGPQGSPGRLEREQTRQNIDIAKQEATQRQQQHDMDFHQKMMDLGANYVHDSGVVQEPMYNMGNPDLPGAGPTNGNVLRKADMSRVVKHKTAEGEQVMYELPTTDQQQNRGAFQRWQQARLNQQPAQMEAETAGRAKQTENRGAALGTAEGKTAGEQADLAARGVNLTQEESTANGLPAATGRVLPEQAVSLAGRIVPTQTRVAGQNDRQQTAIDAKAKTVKSTKTVVGPGGKTVQVVTYNDGSTEEQPLDAVSQVKPAGGKGGGSGAKEDGVRSRFNARQEQKDKDTHQKLFADEQKNWQTAEQYQAAANTADGETFVDPKSGKEAVMNKAQRVALQARMNIARNAAETAQAASKQIRQQRGWGEFGQQQPAQAQTQQSAAQPQQQSAPSGPPKVGEVRQGYKFKGGNPADKNNWQAVQ